MSGFEPHREYVQFWKGLGTMACGLDACRRSLMAAASITNVTSNEAYENEAFSNAETVWPSGLRRWLKAPVRKGVGSNPTAVTSSHPKLE